MPVQDQNKAKAIELAISQIEKHYGQGSIMRLGESPRLSIPVISTGSLSLDYALGTGGVPKGRIIEIYGPESSGKTTLALSIIAQSQKQGGICAFIDAEHALDVNYAEKLGVDVDDLLVSQPDMGEQALDIAELLVRSNAIDIVAIDSVAALVPRAEIDGEIGDTHMGLQARLMSQAMRKLTAVISKSQSLCIFINQIREKIGVMFGSPETTPGGRALKFYSSVRIDIRRIGSIKEKDEIIGNRTRCKVVKNKVAPPFKTAEFDILFGKGISMTGDVLDLAVTHNLVEKSGSWYSYDGNRIGQGRENARQFLQEHTDLFEKLYGQVRHALGMDALAAPAEAEPEEAKPDEEPEEAKPDEEPEEAKPGEGQEVAKPDEEQEEPESDEAKQEEAEPDEVKQGEPEPDEARQSESESDETKQEEAKPDEGQTTS